MQTARAPHNARCYGKKQPRVPVSVTSSNLTKFGNKKRVRRIHLELSYFRDQVQQLELNLKLLKFKTRQHGEQSSVSVWNGIAERQLKERFRAEQKNEKLLESYAGLSKFSAELANFLTKCDENKQELAELTGSKRQRFWDFATESDDDVFSKQLVLVTRLYLNLQYGEKPNRTLYLNSGLSRGNLVVKRDPRVDAGVLLELQCGERVCRILLASKEFWGLVSDISGKYTCRSNVSENEVALVWVEHVDVAEFGGFKFHGLQYQKRGCIKLRRVPRQGPGEQSSSTVVESHFETVPIFHDGAINPMQQMQAFITLIYRSHAKLDEVVCDTMGNMLLEEDWKTTFVGDSVSA